jgi:Fic family protein
VRAIHDTLAIEGSTLSMDQVTAILDGRRVAGPALEIREAKNAVRVYRMVETFDPLSVESLLEAHAVMMEGLHPEAGRWRSGSVGIVRGAEVAHVAPKAARVKPLIEELLTFLRDDGVTHPLIKACVAHYEIEFIHPFADGNGRVGRLWQHLVLLRYHPAFRYVPVESVIRDRQQEYYRVLGESDRAGDSTRFVEFSLGAIVEALDELVESSDLRARDAEARLELASHRFGEAWFTRKDYVAVVRAISGATASRDLRRGVESGKLEKEGERAVTRYRYRKRRDG